LDNAIAGRGNTVFVIGEAGSGKTRITQEFLLAAQEKGVQVLSGWCLSNSSVPYFPFVEAFESILVGNQEDTILNSKKLTFKTWQISSERQLP
jgi:predicted ATPase